MPRCEGLPTGPCPSAVNDASVKNTQGDLFLCKSCEEERFPYTQIKSKGGRSTRSQNPPAQVASKSSSDIDVQCAGCDKLCGHTEYIQCDICTETYDQQCSALPKAVFTTLQTIAHICGWVWYNCRISCKVKLEKTLISQSAITEQIAKLNSTVKQVCDDINKIENKLQHTVDAADDAVPTNLLADECIRSCVVKTMEDINRRESNVVVVGLPEKQDTSDVELFTSFCEVNLTVKPSIVWCRRLGGNNSQSDNEQRPRRLLVKLRSAETATDLRRASRDLRRSNDASVRSVYINPDLTREQAQLA